MPTDLPRHDVTFPEDLYEVVQRLATRGRRSFSGQVVFMLEHALEELRQEADILTQRQSASNGRVPAPVYETQTPEELAKKRAKEIRELHGLEKS